MKLRNCRRPENLQDFGICVQFQEPIRGDAEPGDRNFNDWKDVVLGFIDEDGDYSEFCFNSQRLKKFVE